MTPCSQSRRLGAIAFKVEWRAPMGPLVDSSKPIDFDRIHDATGGDEEFLAELVEIFLEDAELRLQEIRGAVESGDPVELKKTAHKLKGSSANMGANGLMNLSKTLEDMGSKGETEGADDHLGELVDEFAKVRVALEQLVSDAAA